MKTTHKYPLAPGTQTVTAPEGAQWLHADVQGHQMVIWAQVDTDQPTVDHQLHVVATGGPVPDEVDSYLGTIQVARSVFHVFSLPDVDESMVDTAAQWTTTPMGGSTAFAPTDA